MTQIRQMNSTYIEARRHGGGHVLKAEDGTRYEVSNWSNNLDRPVYGWPISETGEKGPYQRLPNNLT